MGYLSELMAIFTRGMIILWRNRLLLLGNLVMPFAIIAIMGPAANLQTFGYLSFEYLTTGIMGMMVFFSGMFIPNNIIWDRDTKYLNIIFVSPCNRSTIVLGYSLVGAVRSTLQILIIYIGACVISIVLGYNNTNPQKGLPYISFSIPVLFGLIGITILVTIFVGGFMTIIASYSKNSETFFLLASIIGMPLIFISNMFFKPENLPFNLGALGIINPLNYLINTIRYLMLGELPPGEMPWEGPLLIIVLAVIFTFLGTYTFVRSVKK